MIGLSRAITASALAPRRAVHLVCEPFPDAAAGRSLLGLISSLPR